jgi:hypothetical protein
MCYFECLRVRLDLAIIAGFPSSSDYFWQFWTWFISYAESIRFASEDIDAALAKKKIDLITLLTI